MGELKNHELEKDYGIIYKVTFPNGKVYIGQTIKTLEHRKRQHLNASKTGDEAVYRAMRKYGIDTLIWEIIDTADTQEDLDTKEKKWISYYNSYTKFKDSNGYNETLGGKDGLRLTCMSIEDLEKFGEYRNSGFSLDEILSIMNLSIDRHAAWSIYNGKTFSYFTNISPRDYKIEPTRAKFTRQELDYIISRYKECGRTDIIADELGDCNSNNIRLIVKGIQESGYTGITSYEFYNKYYCPSIYYNQETLRYIGTLVNDEHRSFDYVYNKVKGNKRILYDIYIGHTLSKYTGIVYSRKNKRLTIPEVCDIWKLYQEGIRINDLAEQFSVSRSTIEHIVTGYSWNNVTGLPIKHTKSM